MMKQYLKIRAKTVNTILLFIQSLPFCNYRNIGSVNSDSSGAFSYQWVPDIPGMYTVIATFAGSNAYWPSFAETSFAVDPPAATPTSTSAPVHLMSGMYFVPAVTAIIAAITIGFKITILVLRRRP